MSRTRYATIHKAYRAYKKSKNRSLNDIYLSYSNVKVYAMQKCLELYYIDKGNDFRIVGYNSQFFSVGYIRTDEYGNDTFVWITAFNTYTMPL